MANKTQKLEKLKKLIDYVLNNKYSNFYQKKYNGQYFKLSTFQDINSIPILLKDEIFSIPLEKRIFNNKKIVRYSISSGTTSNNKPLIVPHTDYYYENQHQCAINENYLSKIGVKKLLILLNPTHGQQIKALSENFNKITIIPGDPYLLEKTGFIIKNLKTEGFYTTPTILERLIPILEKNDFDFDSIKFISLGSELTSRAKKEILKKMFPKAIFYLRYGASETFSVRAYQCKFLAEKSENYYHIADDFLLEIYKPDLDGYGEIIHNDTDTNRAFPLIRYKTDDIGKIEKVNCPCGNSSSLSLKGKVNFDILKFSGAVLATEAIEASMLKIKDYLKPGFSMHAYEKIVDKKIMPELILEIYPQYTLEQRQVDVIKDTVTKNLFLSINKTLNDFINDGLFLPLKIVLKDKPSGLKQKSIVSHLN
ncbi:phenylacetate--CoA ligase family protein [bacterium]|nr:phenylacetate--CoA ligase family protein [bacterium]